MERPGPEPDLTVAVGGGRVLAADDVGDPDGRPVVYLHGAPDCRLARHPDDGIAAAAGVRLLAVDRPGYGASDPDPGLTFGSFGAALDAFLDGAGAERVTLMAWSAGAPWALAAAGALGDRVVSVVCFAAIAPSEALEDDDVSAASGRRGEMAALVRAGDLSPVEVAAEVASLLVPQPPVPLDLARDHVLEALGARSRSEVASVPGLVDVLAESMAASVERHGTAGLVRDLELQLGPGPAAGLLAARCPVRFVHGDGDALSGPAVGRWYASRMQAAETEVWPDAGHHALFARWADLLALTATGWG